MLLDYTLFFAGYCSHPECITIKGGRLGTQIYPALCALITHPHYGHILFDTGYSPRFFDETNKWPLSLYSKITPVNIPKEQTLICQLERAGITPKDITIVMLSHFHADHIAGIKDFQHATILCSKTGFDAVKGRKGITALRKGFLSGLLPHDFEKRAAFLEHKQTVMLDQTLLPFTEGIDILGDQSMIAIALPGHAKGQYGLLFTSPDQQQVFLVADSCWSSRAYREYKLPSALTYLVHDNWAEYQETLAKLHQLYKQNPLIRIIPSHCQEIWQTFAEVHHA